jgi:hypothetical protein
VSLASYEQALARLVASDGYASWFPRVVPLMEAGHREFHVVVDG